VSKGGSSKGLLELFFDDIPGGTEKVLLFKKTISKMKG
jgi:hypothetical protein